MIFLGGKPVINNLFVWVVWIKKQRLSNWSMAWHIADWPSHLPHHQKKILGQNFWARNPSHCFAIQPTSSTPVSHLRIYTFNISLHSSPCTLSTSSYPFSTPQQQKQQKNSSPTMPFDNSSNRNLLNYNHCISTSSV